MPKPRERPDVWVMRDGDTLVPCSELDADLIRRHPEGVRIGLWIHQPRSSVHQRLYWAVLRAVAPATGLWVNAEAMHERVKEALGYQKLSTGFEACDEAEWKEFTQSAFQLIQEKTLPHLSIEQVVAMGMGQLSQQEQDELTPKPSGSM